MRLMSCLRLTVALFICPALRVHNGPGAAKALDLLGDWLRFGAKGATAQAEAADVVEVQIKMAGGWMPGRLISGELHWVQPKPEAADLEAICVVYERANHKVPVAIAALLPPKDRSPAFFDLGVALKSAILRRKVRRAEGTKFPNHVVKVEGRENLSLFDGGSTLCVGQSQSSSDVPQPFVGGACDV